MSSRTICNSFFVLIMVTSFDILFEENWPLPLFHSIIKTYDEVYIALLFIYTFFTKKEKVNTIILWMFLIISIIGFVGNYKSHSSLWVTLLGLYSTTKPILLFWSFCQYNIQWADLIRLFKKFSSFFPIVFISYLFDIFIPTFRYDIGIVAQAEDIRMGLRSLGGLFNRFTVATMFAIIFYIANHYYLKKVPTSKFRKYFSVFMVLFSFKVKDILGFFLAVTLGKIRKFKIHHIVVFAILLFTVFSVYQILMPEHYNRYFNSKDEGNIARVVLTVTSLQIANDNMPFGVGWGMYASPTTIQIESPVYHNYGIDEVYGLSYVHDGGVFMADVFWPMIIGETGYLGLVVYIMILFVAFGPPVKGFLNDSLDLRYVAPAFIFICYLGCSLGKPVFSGPPHSLVLWGFAGLFYSYRNLTNKVAYR